MGEELVAKKPEGKVEMVAPKKAKIKALRNLTIGETTVAKGSIVEVDETLAKELCDKKFVGNYSFSGERSNEDAERHVVRNAERVA